ncbi:MAG TPA: OsmC family protein [Candidatus Binataceae bacterium]|nr:OsmC family protein [Candidatus Binataceae bacterium]
MKLPHNYSSSVTNNGDAYATVQVPEMGELRLTTPADFDGPGGALSPGDLLLAAVEGCFVLTFHAIARASKLNYTALEVRAEGVVDRQDGTTRFTAIVLRPRLSLPPATDRARALRILEKSERGCLVANSLRTPITLEPELVTA